MSNAHAGYIIVRGGGADNQKEKPRGVNAFFGPLDKGSAKPSFCYPKQREALAEEVRGMEKSLADGYVAPTRVMTVKADLRLKKKRLDEIDQQEHEARKLFKENKDACMKRHAELREIIGEVLPRAKDVEKRRVNPQRIHDMEKKGVKGMAPLGKLKTEFQILSHLAEEEPNTKFLQKD